MKKFLLAFAVLLGFASAQAQEFIYNDDLYVTVNDETNGPFNAQVYVSLNEDGTINFALHNFILVTEDGDEMPVGNIAVPNLAISPVEGKENTFTFEYEGIITVQDGSDPTYDAWMGPMLGELPTKLSGILDLEHLYVVIDIDLAALEQIIHVEFGSMENFSDDSNAVYYNDDLYVTVNDETTGPYDAQVKVSMNADGTINFSLNNFKLVTEDGDEMPVGNIAVPTLALTPVDGKENTFTFDFDGILTVQEGSDPAYDAWMGPMLGELPTKMSGILDLEHLYVVIDIDLAALEQIIHVEFGKSTYFNANAIESVEADNKSAFVGAFDLAGRQVSANFKGIRIVNGKKLFTK